MAKRGAALASVLGLVVLLLLVCAMVATLSVTNLNFAQGFRESVQAELLARAAIAQFIADSDQDSAQGTGLNPPPPVSLVQRYAGGNVFPDGGQRLGGTVEVTFDNTQPYYSLDNSGNDQPAAGWVDRGTSDRSVPPFGVNLVMKITCAGKVHHFEAMLRRRWPYVLAGHGPLSFLGGPGSSGGTPSLVKGDLLVYPEHASEPSSPVPVVPVPRDMYDKIVQVAGETRAGVVAVGSFAGSLAQGNSYEGRADFVSDRVVNGKAQIVHANPYNQALPTPRNDRYRIPGYYLDANGQPQSMLAKILKVDPPSGDVLVPPNSQVLNFGLQKRYLLDKDLYLTADASNAPSFTSPTDVVEGTDFVVQGSLGNRFTDTGGNTYATRAGLELCDTTLYVTGDLNLCELEANGTVVPAALRGSNATLIVGGTLFLDSGSLDAVDRSMVIYANSAIIRAKGLFRGLIMIEKSAIFYPADGGGLSIEGGLICNAEPVLLKALSPGEPTFEIRGLALFSTQLNFNPSYLKSIHSFGRYEAMILRRLP